MRWFALLLIITFYAATCGQKGPLERPEPQALVEDQVNGQVQSQVQLLTSNRSAVADRGCWFA